MNHEMILNFVKSLLANFHLTFTTVRKPFELPLTPADLGLRQLLKPDIDYLEISRNYMELCQPNTIYHLQDFFLCRYYMFRLPPDGDCNFAAIGPYTSTVISREALTEAYEDYSFPPDIIAQLEKYYQEIPFIADESYLQTLLYTLGEWLWGGADQFTIQDIPDLTVNYLSHLELSWDSQPPGSPLLSMKALEQRYAAENELIKAVALGQTNKADVILNQFAHRQLEQRTQDPLRDKKNYAIICNTLLRKAAESACIHPLYLDRLSAKYASQIELCISLKSVDDLQKEMIHSYCLLVREHSLKDYSPLIRQVILQIDADLTADLSLYSLSRLLNVNSSYLSSLFKKETGATLTEYVNKKRARQAALLLRTTNMQIQMIAQYCGIPDVNYFIRIFKKYAGKTPKEYRDSLNGK